MTTPDDDEIRIEVDPAFYESKIKPPSSYHRELVLVQGIAIGFGVGFIAATLLSVCGCGGAAFEAAPDAPSVLDAQSPTSDAAANDRARVRLEDGAAPDAVEVGGQPDAARVEAAVDVEAASNAASNDADAATTVDALGADACAPVIHMNGLGATYVDCVPPGTFNDAQALKACRANYGSSCATIGYTCGHDAGSNQCACWQIAGSNAGWVFPGTYQAGGCAGTGPAKMWN